MNRQRIAYTIPFNDPDAFEDVYSEPETDEDDSLDVGPEQCRHRFVTSCGATACIHCRKVAWR